MDMEKLAPLLEGTMTFAESDGELYFTTPVASGELSIESDGTAWYREWSGNHGVSYEKELTSVPDVPVHEQACFIRLLIIRTDISTQLPWDEYQIYEKCREAQHKNVEISHGTARAIATQFLSSLDGVEAFISTGDITTDNLWYNLVGEYYSAMSDKDKLCADMLGTYLVQRRMLGQMSQVPLWSISWVNNG
jgi:hypothetical protein